MANTLSPEDARLYYEIFFPLLDYVNRANHIVKDHTFSHDTPQDPAACYEVAQKLWEDTSIIDTYLSEQADLSDDEKKILSSWKMSVTDDFFAERELKNGTVFLSKKTGEAFLVCGTTSTMEENFGFRPLPVALHTTLIPFRNVIITDGLMSVFPVFFGGGIRQTLKDTYTKAKATGHYYTSMDQKYHPETSAKPAVSKSQTQARVVYTLKVYPKKYSSYTFRTYAVSENTKIGTFTNKLLDTWNLDPSTSYACQMGRENFTRDSRLSDLSLKAGDNFLLYYGEDWVFQIHVQKADTYLCARLLRLINWKGERDCLDIIPGGNRK